MRVGLVGEQLCSGLTDALRLIATNEEAMAQEDPQQVKIVVADVARGC